MGESGRQSRGQEQRVDVGEEGLPGGDELVAASQGGEVPGEGAVLGGEIGGRIEDSGDGEEKIAEQTVHGAPVKVGEAILDLRAGVGGGRGDAFDLVPQGGFDGGAGKRGCDGDPEIGQGAAGSGAEGDRGDIGVRAVGAGDDRQGEFEVVEVASQRAVAAHDPHGSRTVAG